MKAILTFYLIGMFHGCIAQMIPFQSVEITYDARGNRIMRKLFDPNATQTKKGDAINTIEESEIVLVYPNPANETVTVEFNEADSNSTRLDLYDMTGRVLIQSTIRAGEIRQTISVKNLRPGMYQIVIRRISSTKTVSFVHL